MKTAANLLKSKAHQSVHTITPEASVFDAIKLMADKNIGALLVMEGERITGIVTERDYARKIVLLSRSSRETPVRDIMTSAVIVVRRLHSSQSRRASRWATTQSTAEPTRKGSTPISTRRVTPPAESLV